MLPCASLQLQSCWKKKNALNNPCAAFSPRTLGLAIRLLWRAQGGFITLPAALGLPGSPSSCGWGEAGFPLPFF